MSTSIFLIQLVNDGVFFGGGGEVIDKQSFSTSEEPWF